MSGRPSQARQVGWWTAVVLIFLVLYVLSVGPVAWLVEHFDISPNDPVDTVIGVIYWPLEWLYEHVSLIERFFDWCAEFWE